MPTRLPAHLVPAGRRDEVCLGVEAEFAGPVVLPLAGQGLFVAGRGGSGRTSTLLGLAQAAATSLRPPRRVVLVGPRAATAPGVAADLVLDDLGAFVDWAQGPDGLRAADGVGPDEWSLLLLDDVHTWERAWDAGGPARDDLVAAAGALEQAMAAGWGVVLASDPDEARSRGHVAGPGAGGAAAAAHPAAAAGRRRRRAGRRHRPDGHARAAGRHRSRPALRGRPGPGRPGGLPLARGGPAARSRPRGRGPGVSRGPRGEQVVTVR